MTGPGHGADDDAGTVDDPAIVDVAIIGYGPVGAVLTGLLARRGLDVMVIDRTADLYPLPRAAHCDDEIIRVLQELGCADRVVADGMINAGMSFLDADRNVLVALGSPPADAVWPRSLLFHQPSFEGAIRTVVEQTSARRRFGAAATVVDASASDHVAVHLDDGEVVRARFVVGCDGARSLVRRHLGGEVDDAGFEEPWLVVDLLVDDRDVRATIPDRCLQVCDPARPTTVVPMPSPRLRMEFMLLPGETADAMLDDAVVRTLVSPWFGFDAVTVERAAVYTFHGLVARCWRNGRVLLAGDAAHQMPPFLGQGMCSGIRDAANLAWKLEAVLRGAPADLLDTYQAERSPHVAAIIETAVDFGRIICTLDPDVAAERDADMRTQTPAPPRGSPHLGPSPLVGPGGGGIARQAVVDGTRLDEIVGNGFALLVRTGALGGGEDLAWWSTVAPVVELGDLQHDAVAVRPDRYVLAAGSMAEVTAFARSLPAGVLDRR